MCLRSPMHQVTCHILLAMSSGASRATSEMEFFLVSAGLQLDTFPETGPQGCDPQGPCLQEAQVLKIKAGV
jgi:hypothetical protein